MTCNTEWPVFVLANLNIKKGSNMTNSPQITASHFQQNQQPMKDNPVQDVKDKKERKRKCISNTYTARHKSIQASPS